MAEVELKKELKELDLKYNQKEDLISFRFNKTGEYIVDLEFTDLAGNKYIKLATFIIYGSKYNQINPKT